MALQVRRVCAMAAIGSLLTLAAGRLPAAEADDGLVVEIEQRLAAGTPDQVNRHLSANWAAAMLPLNRLTSGCDLGAVRLAVALSRSAVANAAKAHVDALRVASGGCLRFVLALAQPADLPRVCASASGWGLAQTARELRRRIAAIDADELLASTQAGKTCRAAYRHELETTRVVLQRRP